MRPVSGRAYSRDPTVYDNPEAFMPERFLTPDGKFDRPDVRDPATIAFGYGRRSVITLAARLSLLC